MRQPNEFFISGYLMPPRNEEAFSDLKNSHLNHIYLDFTPNLDITEKALSLCDEFDINAIIMTCWSRYDNPSFELVTKNALNHKSFCGVNGLDEPIFEDFGSINKELDAFKEKYPDKTFYVNMVNCNVPQKFIATDENVNYSKLVDEYEKLLNNMCFDKTASMTIYPLMLDEEGKNNVLHPKHLQSFEFIRKAATNTNAELYFFVQAMPFRQTHRKPSLVDLYFQVNTGLAFGAKGVQYFCYRTPDPNWEFNDQQYSMILKDGTKTDTYFNVKTVNEMLITIAPYYLSLDYKNTYGHINNAGIISDDTFVEFSNKNNDCSSLVGLHSTRDLLIGEFLNGNKKAFYLVNYGEPSKQTKNYVEFSLEDKTINTIKVFQNNRNNVVRKFSDKFSLLINKGEGVLVLYD